MRSLYFFILLTDGFSRWFPIVPGGIAPESLTFTPLEDMIFLKWEEPVEPNGLITQYEVCALSLFYRTSINFSHADWILHRHISIFRVNYWQTTILERQNLLLCVKIALPVSIIYECYVQLTYESMHACAHRSDWQECKYFSSLADCGFSLSCCYSVHFSARSVTGISMFKAMIWTRKSVWCQRHECHQGQTCC